MFEEPNESKEPDLGAHAADGAGRDQKASPDMTSGINRIKTPGADAPKDAHAGEHHSHPAKPEKWWDGMLYDAKLTDIIIVAFTAVLTFNSCRQNSLMNSANTISGEAASASKEAAIAASNTFKLQKDGEKSAAESLNATKKSAAAAESTAVAAKSSADAARATADGVASTAESIAAAITLSREANVTAARAAEAARDSARAAAEANAIAKQAADAATQTASWSAFAAEKQLRAYISVDSTSLIFNREGGYAEATIILQNSGITFAHNVTATGKLVCVPKGSPWPAASNEFSPPSIGPSKEFKIRLRTPWGGTSPAEMVASVSGRVEYTDEFNKPRYTEFNFVAGDALSATEFEMVYAADGNNAN